MNRKLRFFVFLMSWVPLSLAAPYGEWGLFGWDGSEGIPMNEVQPGMEMPDEIEVGYPAYPGAKVMLVFPTNVNLPEECMIVLRTVAPISSVCHFYEAKLKASEGYVNRLRDELSCNFLAEEPDVVGLIATHNPDEMYASKNGSTEISISFYPKNSYSCSIAE